MPTAEILTIGTEILLGEIVDTNSAYIARALRDRGIDLLWTSTVGDNISRIVDALQRGIGRSDIIITTGGLGPTVDDPTREAVAQAVGVETEYREELWQQILERYARFSRTPTENNKRQAYVPQGAIAVENLVGTAPAFIVESRDTSIICLPGVPSEMKHLLGTEVFPYLEKTFGLTGIIVARVIHTVGAGESQIDDLIGDLEKLENPTVGLAAHAGRTDVRITAKAENEASARQLIQSVEDQIYQRVGEWIYGVDDDTLEDVALQNIADNGWTLAIYESGLEGQLTRYLAQASGSFLGGELGVAEISIDELEQKTHQARLAHNATTCLGVLFVPGDAKQELHVVIETPERTGKVYRSYGGPPQMARQWAVVGCLDALRRLKPD